VPESKLKAVYIHEKFANDGKKLCHGNIIWAERNEGNAYYRTSRYAMRGGKFPPFHPVSPNSNGSNERAEMGASDPLKALRERGYWASCFPEGDGITMECQNGQTAEQAFRDIQETLGPCFESIVMKDNLYDRS